MAAPPEAIDNQKEALTVVASISSTLEVKLKSILIKYLSTVEEKPSIRSIREHVERVLKIDLKQAKKELKKLATHLVDEQEEMNSKILQGTYPCMRVLHPDSHHPFDRTGFWHAFRPLSVSLCLSNTLLVLRRTVVWYSSFVCERTR